MSLPRAQRMIRHMLKTRFKITSIADSGAINSEVVAHLNKLPADKVVAEFVDYRAAMFRYSAGQLPASDHRYELFKKFNSRTDQQRAAYGSRYVEQWVKRATSYALNPLLPVAEVAASGNGAAIIAGTALLAAAGYGIYYLIENTNVSEHGACRTTRAALEPIR